MKRCEDRPSQLLVPHFERPEGRFNAQPDDVTPRIIVAQLASPERDRNPA